MTFWAKRADDGKHVDVNVTSGPIIINVREDPGHLRNFHGELGRLLDQVEADQKAEV
jgi:hypothetical protein